MEYSALVMREGYLTAHTILLVLMIACILRTQELFAVSSFETIYTLHGIDYEIPIIV